MYASPRSVSRVAFFNNLTYGKMEGIMNLPEKPSLREIVCLSHDIIRASKLISAWQLEVIASAEEYRVLHLISELITERDFYRFSMLRLRASEKTVLSLPNEGFFHLVDIKRRCIMNCGFIMTSASLSRRSIVCVIKYSSFFRSEHDQGQIRWLTQFLGRSRKCSVELYWDAERGLTTAVWCPHCLQARTEAS